MICEDLHRGGTFKTLSLFCSRHIKLAKSMKILVTGSAGHLGEALVRTLQQQDHEVIGADILPSAFTHKVGSIVDRDFVRQCMQGVQVVLHSATLHKPQVHFTAGEQGEVV